MNSVWCVENALEAGWQNRRSGDRWGYCLSVWWDSDEGRGGRHGSWGEGFESTNVAMSQIHVPYTHMSKEKYLLNITCLLWTESCPPPQFIHWSSNPNAMWVFGSQTLAGIIIIRVVCYNRIAEPHSPSVSDLVSLGWGLKFAFLTKFSEDADAAGRGPYFENHCPIT